MDETSESLAEIVGEANVVQDPGMGEPFSLAHDLTLALKPRCTVRPSDVGEVQEIVAWANETHTPLVPMSSGEPHLHGGTLPSEPDSVIVDLSGMKRILRLDRRNRLALIEPGVTFAELQPELEKQGLRLVTPLMPRSSKSVLASLLEREPVTSPRYQWNLLEPLRSLEIVWGNGDKFWSGGGTFRGETEEDWREGKIPLVGPGPGQLDFYKMVSAAQGSMGIVTWASVKCEVLPDFRRLFIVPAEKLEALLDFAYRLLRFRFADELFIVNAACLAAILAGDAAALGRLRADLPAWCVVVGISGGQILAREQVRAREQDIGDIAQQFGLRLASEAGVCRAGQLMEVISKPSAEPYWKLRHKGGGQELFFLTTLGKTPGFVDTMYMTANELQRQSADIAVYLQPVHQGVGCHCEFVIPFDRHDSNDKHKALELFRRASRRLFRQKAYFSRPYGIWASMVFNADARTTMVTQTVKQIFDPNRVMNPGKLCF